MQEAKANGSMSSSASSANGGKENSPQKSAAGGSEQKRLFITHVQASGPYLQVAGQLNPDAAAVVHTKMQQLLAKCSPIDASWDAERQVAALRIGSQAIHKVVKGAAPDDHDLYRAKILRVNTGAKGITVEVEYVDYGYTKQVASHELHLPQHEVLQQIPVLGGRYILCGICKDWEPQEIATIEDMILQKMVDVRIEMEFNAFKFITMKWKEFDFSEYLVHHKKMGAPIANNLLRDNFVKYYQLNQQQQQRGETTPSSTVTMTVNNNHINNNQHNNNNTNEYRKTNFGNDSQYNNNNNMITNNNKNTVSPYPATNQKYAKYPSDVLAPPMAAYQQPFQPKRSLQNRLQRYQNPQMMQADPMVNMVKPCMPHTIGNLRSMMQSVHMQNSRFPYVGPPANGQLPVVQPIAVPYNWMGGYSQPSPLAARLNTFQTAGRQQQIPPAVHMATAHNGGDMPQQGPTEAPPAAKPPRAAAFKSNSLTVGKTYDVCVSFVENGPCLFSVQLATAQDELTKMMNNIERLQFRPLSNAAVLGTACIARYSEDGQLYRALITNVQPAAAKVAYIDYGNAEVVNSRELYEITEEFLQPKAFAIRFTLSGHKELEPMDDSLKKTFKDLVMYKNCKLKVMPLEGPPLVQYCELYLNNQNVLDVLKQVQKCRLDYPKAVSLQNGDAVEIRYTDSPKCFFVQKVADIDKFEKLMDDMFQYYNKNQVVPDPLKLGSPCMVKTNNEWYRAEILRADSITTTVRFVDYGNEKNVTQNVISVIAEEHLKMPCQAVQCCLKGFENNELNMDLATSQMEMLAETSNLERRRFTAKVFRIQPDGSHLVNLFTKDINLMKKLYKLSMPFEQYLSLEKEDFNLSYNPAKHAKQSGNDGGSHKSPSIVSSNDQQSQKHAKQWKQQQLQQQLQMAEQQRPLRNGNNQQDWERSGSGDKRDRDSRSNSSDFKRGGKNDHQQQLQQQQHQQYRGQGPHHQQPQKENMQHLNGSIGGGSDRRSTGSGASSNWNKNRQQNFMESPPRSVNSSNSNNKQDNRRQTPQKQQKNQRSQNAPQGYSQHSPTKSVTGSPAPSANTSMEESSSNAASEQATIEYMPLDHAFPTKPLTCPAREEVEISWWESPHLFYTHLKRRLAEFQRLEQDMQKFYKRKTWQQLQVKVGSNVIVRYRKDNCLYRARIVSCNQMLRKYRAFFVDYGYLYMVMADDIWQVERRFAQLPCMAYMCGFRGIVLNQDHLSLVDRMEKYVPQGAALVCDYREREDDKDTMYYVDVTVNKKSLRDIFKADGIITDVRSDIRLSLLGGQQIMAKLCSIKDMLHFKIETEAFGQQPAVQLLSSYDDVRFVKSNSDVARKFKSFYEGKTLVVNIKEVNNNKVVQLRPLLPLLTEDHVQRICTYPVVFESFDLKVVYVASHYRLYGHLAEKEQDIAALLDDLFEFYEKDNGAPLKTLAAEQVCAAKSSDGNWYRAKILAPGPKDNSPDVHVHFIDYGNDESVPLPLVKPLNKKFAAKSSYAIEVNLPLRPLTSDKGKSKKATPLEAESLAAKAELEKSLVGQFVAAKALEVRQNHLMADIRMKDGKDVIELLRGKKLVKGRDVDYMRKQLDKEKPNMLEYIETVDLTLEDEEEGGEKKGRDQKAKTSSPKKKKEKPAKDSPEASPVKGAVEAKEPPKPKEAPAKPEEPKKPEEKAVQPEPPKPEVAQPPPKKEEEPAPKAAEPEPEPERQPEPDPYADMEMAVLSHCDNPAQFFVHPQHKVEQLRKLQENLQIVASSLPPLMRVINGAHCISLYSVDKQWYRAQIIDAELMVLKFIDYGNTDCVTDTTDVKEMSVFPDIEPLCIPCSLPIKPNGTADWVDAANAIFNDSYTKRLHFEFITRGDEHKRSFIKLFIEGTDIAAKLIEDGYARPLVVVDSGENCYISHMNGITDFYIQYEKESKALELIEIHLSQNESFRKLEQFERSKIVAALFPDDSMWYRAKLLREVPGKGYEVLFIDYGNTSISPECREISDDIAQLPPLSKKCSLELPDNCLSWSDAAEEKFAEIAAAGETIFTVELREPASDHALVHLFIDGHNVNDDLEPLCEHKPPEIDMNASFCNTTLQTSIYESGVQYDALVSHVNTPHEFYIQFNKDTGRLEDITASLNSLNMEPLVKPEVGDLCGAIFPADKAFYRARVQAINADGQEYRVRFIDFGNEAFTKDLRSLPQDLLELKELSQLCRLDGDFQMNGATVKAFHDIVAACEGSVKVEFLGDCDEEPALVRLITGDTQQDVAMQLMSIPQVPEKVSKECRISHATTPTNFYIQPLTNAAQMDLVSRALLKDEAEKLPLVEGKAEKGSLCCVYSKEDELFYRGRIEQVLPEDKGYEVFLLDSGNTINVLEARQLTEELAALPPLAWRCTLKDLPEGSEAQLEAQFAALLEAHFGETFEIESDELDAATGVHTVKLQVDYKDLGEQLGELVRKGSQEEVLSPVPTLLDCAVIHVNSPKSFYVQLSRDIEQVQNITDVLLDAETDFEPFADLTVGAICAAQFPDDSAFYRARIERVLDEGKCEVHYLDFGNNSVTDQFRSLPASILTTEELSKHCALEGTQLGTAEAQAHFEAFVDSRFSETFQLEFLKTSSDPQIVRLFYQEKDVAGEVMKLVKSQKAGAAGDAGLPNGVEKPAEESN